MRQSTLRPPAPPPLPSRHPGVWAPAPSQGAWYYPPASALLVSLHHHVPWTLSLLASRSVPPSLPPGLCQEPQDLVITSRWSVWSLASLGYLTPVTATPPLCPDFHNAHPPSSLPPHWLPIRSLLHSPLNAGAPRAFVLGPAFPPSATSSIPQSQIPCLWGMPKPQLLLGDQTGSWALALEYLPGSSSRTFLVSTYCVVNEADLAPTLTRAHHLPRLRTPGPRNLESSWMLFSPSSASQKSSGSNA